MFRELTVVMRRFIWAGLALFALSLAGFGAWVFSLPAPVAAEAPPVTRDEMDAMLASLKPPKRARPLVAIIGINDATETTDYLVPTGILRRADVAYVITVATGPGPVKLFPVLTVEADTTILEFDARNPNGADYVIVPAMSRDDDPTVLAWLQGQAMKGATIIGICAGAKVVGAAGLLDGKRATTHWYYLEEMLERNPSIDFVPNRRIVTDRGVATTTGITASMPMSLALIEAIAGGDKAMAVAQDLGVTVWDARHDSAAFKFTRSFALTVIGNTLAFWNREKFAIEISPGVDEISLALVADAWSRTYRSRAVTFADAAGAIESLGGIRILPDQVAVSWPEAQQLPAINGRQPAMALDIALRRIASRYGTGTANVVAMQLEYPGRRKVAVK